MKKHSFLHKGICLLAALMMACACSGAMAQAAQMDSAAAINLREQPDNGAKVLGRFFSGAQVDILGDAGNGFSKVSLGTGMGTVSGYVMTETLAAQAQTDATKTAYVVSPYGTQSVVLRSRPSNSYDAVAMLMVGDRVLIIGEAGQFRFVQTGSGCVGCLLESELK